MIRFSQPVCVEVEVGTHVFWGWKGNNAHLTETASQPAFPTKVMERKASMLAQRGKVGEQTAKAGIRSVGGGEMLEVVEVEFPPQGFTPLKFNSSPPKNRPGPKRKLIFQPSFFRGELLNFGGVVGGLVVSNDVFFFLYAFYTKILRK